MQAYELMNASQVKDDGKPTTTHIISLRGITDIILLGAVEEELLETFIFSQVSVQS